MKYLFLFLCVLLNMHRMLAQQLVPTNFILSGNIIAPEGTKMKLFYLDANKNSRIDSSMVVNGRFSFSGLITEPTHAKLYGNVKTRLMDDPNTLNLFLEPSKMSINLIEDEFYNANVVGSVTQNELQEIYKKTGFVNDSIGRNDFKINSLRKQKLKGDNIRDVDGQIQSLRNKNHIFYDKFKNESLTFIETHPKSFLSPYLLFTQFNNQLSKDSLNLYYKTFSAQVQGSLFGQAIFKFAGQKEYQMEVGTIAQNFSASTLKGSQVNLNDYKGKKIVLLDFWGTWCKPCRDSSPQLIKFYNEFKDKGVEIISVSGDGDKKLWKSVIEQDGTGQWTHITVKDAGVNKSGDNLMISYNINAVPTFYLIDKTGKIAWGSRGYGDSLYQVLKNKVEELNR